MNFKDQLAIDAAVFFNPNEFGETHLIEGRQMVIVIDNHELTERKANTANPDDGIHDAEILFYAKRDDFPQRPDVDSWLVMDGKQYRVAVVQEDDVSYTIALRANGS
ncbi:hypothetical protein P9G84_23110 [Brevibacillus centrosporus]|uniref:hypothetical protein n=2 Tax=Brevibacillus centrosporus TaxID=54910 RepID=UPI000F09DD78|nr:hypothetical protein [Brevibacillus centrosporus]MEC2131821.1 hypothetical protein [Brevibacillus centrosporus]RNB64048.1 hypothetical protein EDM55_28270 [Brevibacillus centrosporus]